ncbi:MAG: glycosyltransferase family 39 protein [Acidimicrobiales bacterium]
MGLLALAGLALRAGSRSPLWLDEALTVEIARLPIVSMLDALRQDGAPPLYYLLLHGWMKALDTGDVAVRSLSAVFSIATIPVLYLIGRRRGAGLTAVGIAVLFATSPFAIRYATETRMYSLVALIVAVGWLVVADALRQPTALRLSAVGLLSGLLLLTHYWGFYLLAGLAGVGVVQWRSRADLRSPVLRVGVAAAAGGALLFAPWVPTFVYQAAHTGTPWGTPPGPVGVAVTTLVDLGGGPHPEGQALAVVLAGLILLALMGTAIDRHRIEVDVRTRPGVRTEVAIAALTVAAGVGVGLLTGAAWASRYNSVVIPLVMVAAAYGITALADQRLAVIVLIVAAALGVAGGLRNATTDRTQARETAATINAAGEPGALVVYCPDQVAPDVQRLLGDGFRQVTFPDFDGPQLIDWTDYEERVSVADPVAFAEDVLRRASGQPVFYVWMSGYRTHGKLCEKINDTLAGGSVGSVQLQEPAKDLFERHIVWVHPERAS